MCSHYRVNDRLMFSDRWQVSAPPGWEKTDLWPGYRGPFIRRLHDHDEPGVEEKGIEALAGVFGLLPFWSKDEKLAKSTYNCRSETASTKPSFRDAWKRGQHCIIPAASIYEPDWRTGKAIPTRIAREDGEDLGIAGLWERWKNPAGETVHSYTMLTMNADGHDLMRNYHRPTDEKRMVVILPRGLYDDWLDATAERSMEFMRQFPADRLIATPEPRA
jgi:putative SOS response-associated peptidase YedK